MRMPIVTGSTNGSNTCVTTPSPSTALSTEMAGVMMPSPYSRAAPNRPTAIRTPRSEVAVRERTSATSARMPPSPSLSARITNTRYLIETMTMSDQKISESTPSTLPVVTGTAWDPEKHSRSA